MKATVDKNTCIGCGLCCDTCPDVFEMDGNIAKVIADPVPKDAEDTCREAADNCPVNAISVQE